MKTIILATAAVLSLTACGDMGRTASGFLCPNGRAEVPVLGVGPSQFGSCDVAAQDAVDRLVAQGREYRYLTAGEAHAVAFNSIQPGMPAGTLPATGTPGFGVRP